MIPANKPKPVRLRSKALREVRAEQSKVTAVIPTAPFHRLIREMTQDQTNEDIRFRKDALEALQTDAEDFLIGMFHDANLIAIQGHRETLHVDDIKLWKTIKGI
jgi:histone H3/H4